MPIFGRYEVVSELHAGTPASVFRAKLVIGRHAQFVVKLLQHEDLESQPLRQDVEVFLEQARAQKQAGADPLGNWASIHHFAKTPGGAFYISDLAPASVQTLIQLSVVPTSRELARLVAGIVRGLRTMREVLNRAHGNLKPSNVLLSSFKLDGASVRLTDPASNLIASQVGEAGDLHALGRLIFELIEHRPPLGDIDATVPSTPQWRQLGSDAEGWRQLCADLLAPQDEKSEGHLGELAALVNKLGRAKPGGSKRWMLRTATVFLVAGGVASAFDFQARRELFAARTQWIDPLAAEIAKPPTMKRFRDDPALCAVMLDVTAADDPAVAASNQLSDVRPWEILRVRSSLAAAERVGTDLSPAHWPVAARLRDAQQTLERSSWTQPAHFVAAALAQLKPGPGLDSAILNAIQLDAILQNQLPALTKSWADVEDNAGLLQKSNDVYLSSFATMLRKSAADALQLSATGFGGTDVLRTNNDLITRLLTVVRDGFPSGIDAPRFFAEVTSRIDYSHPQIADVKNWLQREPFYAKQDAQTAAAAKELRIALRRALDQIARLHPDAGDRAEVEAQRKLIEHDLDLFEHRHFTSHDMADGTFVTQRTGIDSQIESLIGHVHRVDPTPWVASLPTLATRSDVINAYWEDWKHVLRTSTGEMARRNDLFQTFRRQTEALRKTLTGLDADFPAVPSQLAGAFAASAASRRESELGKLLAAIDAAAPQAVLPGQKSAADSYRQWCDNLVALGHDFPIRAELLTFADNPDEPWKHTKADFWNDTAVQHLVAADVKRLANLRAISKLTRPDLIDAATESTVPEITFAAWQLLGEASISPAWPSQAGELETERDMRDKLASMIAGLKDPKAKGLVGSALANQGIARWRRFVQSATSEAMLQHAIELKRSFGPDADLFSGLSAAGRFNIALYLGRQQVHDSDDHSTATLIAALKHSAQDLPDQKPVQRLLARLARLDTKERFADQNPGDRFTLAVPGANPPFVFQRVEPPNERPFYLCTTAVSFGQFAGVVQAAGAWQQTAAFSWGVAPGQPDLRRGPRVWEWLAKPALQMTTPLLWLHPDDDNDYAPPFRIDRFNRTALSDDVGGNPTPDHPMQQIPAEAALYYSGLCGCRLPTAAEWRDAYAIFERTVPPERWNLRDQTWDQQRRYAADSASPTVRWPDEGIFRPEEVTIAAGADAKARPENDGTLFFRPVNGPGGGTFHSLIGNVAQLICEAPDQFEDLADKSSAAAIRAFLAQWPNSLFVIGGSALSPPDVPLQSPLPVVHTDVGYADVGLRLAFTAPARSLSERLAWMLAGQSYLWEKSSPTTAAVAQ